MKRIKASFLNFKVGSKLSLGIVIIVSLLMATALTVLINSYRSKLIEDSKKIMAAELATISAKLDGELVGMGNFANSLASAQENGLFGNRESTLAMMRDFLYRNDSLQGAWVNLEPNADGLDSQYLNDTLNCIEGRFIPYYYWNNPLEKDKINKRPSSSLDGFDFYELPKVTTKKFVNNGNSRRGLDMATISEPFFTEEGDPLTSVTVPIIIDNQFKGVGGVDRSLIAFAKDLAKLKPYESANAFLVSRKKILVASGVRGKENVGKPVTELEGYNDEFFSIFDEKKAGFKRVFRPRNNAYAFYVYEKNERSGWTIAMSVVEDEILRPINKTILQISIGAAVALLLSIGFIFFLSNLVIVKPINNIMNLFSEIGMGNFEARAEVKNQDELGVMAESLNAMLDNTLSLIQSREERNALEGSIMKLLEDISAFTEGDLTARAEVTEDITGAIADSFNLMAEKIGLLVRQVSIVAGQVTDTSLDVSASTEKLAESSTDQATQIIDAVHTINTMADTIREVANNAVQSAQVSGQSTMNAKEGAEAVDKTNESMTAIRENVQETARAIKRLGESSQEIGNIVQIIGDIADRTSILALNASIQAAMAGDAGRGFAVVAEEVQSLAERSTNSAKQIDTIIKTIQGEITEAGASMDESIQRVVEGAQLADDARTKLEEIQTISGQVAELIHSIAQASEAQAQTSEKTSKTMERIGQISSNTSQASLETASQMKDLKQIADKLTETISAFKIEVE